jgi:hypothetical protein
VVYVSFRDRESDHTCLCKAPKRRFPPRGLLGSLRCLDNRFPLDPQPPTGPTTPHHPPPARASLIQQVKERFQILIARDPALLQRQA